MRSGRPSGFTLLEALCTLCVFGFFLALLFLTLGWGFRSFSLAVAKSDVTTEARRVALFVERELRSSTYFSVTTLQRRFGDERRDAICFVSRDDWSSSDSFNRADSQPRWNRYFVYYATLEEPFGRFYRLVLQPLTAAELGPFPYGPFTDPGRQPSYLRDSPTESGLADLESARLLAQSVQSFSVNRIAASQELEFRLLLRQSGLMARRANGDREGGTFELHYRVQPQNTR